ncbi:MAG TPA: NADH-quinone oxidoreductase subunit C [Phycisphaerae bacterium]|nr:NADH-quinone oxidoreductase subunit C [Phycisphaerae bacterium]
MLTFDGIVQRVASRFGGAVAGHAGGMHPWMGVAAERWGEAAAFLRDEMALSFSMLRCLTGMDYPDRRQMAAVYELLSFEHGHGVCVKVFVPREKPVIPSVAAVWRAADWHEREAYDLLGIVFAGHPDAVRDGSGEHPRRILLPEDWAGHPLRKDYEFPREYQGIPGSVEMEWAQKAEYPK